MQSARNPCKVRAAHTSRMVSHDYELAQIIVSDKNILEVSLCKLATLTQITPLLSFLNSLLDFKTSKPVSIISQSEPYQIVGTVLVRSWYKLLPLCDKVFVESHNLPFRPYGLFQQQFLVRKENTSVLIDHLIINVLMIVALGSRARSYDAILQ